MPDVQEIDWIRNGEKSDINYLMKMIKNKKVNLHFFLEERQYSRYTTHES